jgi:hypothetical protein
MAAEAGRPVDELAAHQVHALQQAVEQQAPASLEVPGPGVVLRLLRLAGSNRRRLLPEEAAEVFIVQQRHHQLPLLGQDGFRITRGIQGQQPVKEPSPVSNRAPKTLWDNDVLLLRQTFDLPPLKDGYRYRIRVAGSVHNNMGEGFAIYANGKLLAENHEGVLAWRRQGGTPRGTHVFAESRELFQTGWVTLAIGNFPMRNWSPGRFVPPGAALTVWMEQQKLPPVAE